MSEQLLPKLIKLGFSEYEAKAYIALLGKNPVSGYELAKQSGVPRSMIYEVAGKLASRGAVLTLHSGSVTRYAPVPAAEFLDQLQQEHENLVNNLKEELTALEEAPVPDLDYVWNIEGIDNVLARAVEMIDQAQKQIYLALLPVTFVPLQPALSRAVGRGVRTVLYTTAELDLPGGEIAVAHVSEETLGRASGLGFILVIDGTEVLIGERLSGASARGSWTGSSLLVFIAEHHLRTDLYLPEILSRLGDNALEIIKEEDRELFARALESEL
jgi:sugar-specific transcriptional regulator TrmB